ncbi:MAG: CHASE2 domain-containing protein, partial [Cyanobacteria bacterium J06632_3]
MAAYRLKVTKVEQICLFELTNDRGLSIQARLPYPDAVEALYKKWQRIYLRYYQGLDSTPSLRGRKIASGQMSATTDWHSQLVQAETDLLIKFRQWLNNGALIEIRRTLSQSSTPFVKPSLKSTASREKDSRATDHKSTDHKQKTFKAARSNNNSVDLMITCDSASLGRLPWEMWDLGSEFSTDAAIRISRVPASVRMIADHRVVQRKARVLVILGDETGLDFDQERKALSSLSHLISVDFVGWRAGTDAIASQTTDIKQTIVNAIQASPGWDMLLFFGHSNEANSVGGQIAIAPNTALSISELKPCLRQAKSKGLKFALFNSCNGIDIANALIDIGLSQVAIMREPIHNRVAQIFLIQFLQHLSQFDDVHTALQKASQTLQAKNLKYPSAYLVPSLFRHGQASLFRLQPSGWRTRLSAVLPKTRLQYAALSLLTVLSFTAPVTQFLLSYRLLAQALYRQRLPQPKPPPPPVLLVQIDRESIRRGIPDGVENPMNRAYLADILERLNALNAQVVGMDYLLDGAQIENDAELAQAIEQAVSQESWLVFAAILEGAGEEVGVREDLASLNWAMEGYTNTPKWYLRSLAFDGNCEEKCPYAYLLALTQLAQRDPSIDITPSLQSLENLREQLLATVEEKTLGGNNKNQALQDLYTLRLSIWATVSRLWKQRWLHHVLDFSIPPEQIFTRLSAYQLLEEAESQRMTSFDTGQIVIVASGGYGEAGTDYDKDYSPLPPAIAHWHRRQADSPRYFTGGEANAYAVHHFFNAHYVIPIPDVFLLFAGALAGAN